MPLHEKGDIKGPPYSETISFQGVSTYSTPPCLRGPIGVVLALPRTTLLENLILLPVISVSVQLNTII